MKKYYLIAKEIDNISIYTKLAYYNETQGRINKMLKYYMLGVENGENNCGFYLGNYYKSIGKDDTAICYYLISKSYKSIGDLYKEKENYDEMIKWYLMEMTNECGRDVLCDVGDYYMSISKYDISEKFYLASYKHHMENKKMSGKLMNLYLSIGDVENYEYYKNIFEHSFGATLAPL